MDVLMRMTGAVAALGSALIALAVGAAPSLLGTAPWLAVPVLAAGAGQLVVAVLALRGAGTSESRLRSASALAALVVPTVAWLGALLAAPAAAAAMPMGPMLAETALALSAAALLARAAERSATGEPAALTALLSLVGSAAIVAAVATSALAGTEAGRSAVPHGEHGAQQPAQQDGDPAVDESLLEEHDHR